MLTGSTIDDQNNALAYQEIEENACEELFQYFIELRTMLESKSNEMKRPQDEGTESIEEKIEKELSTTVKIVSKSKRLPPIPEPQTNAAIQSADRLWNYYNHLLETFKQRLPDALQKHSGSIALIENAKHHLYRFYLGEVCKLYKDTNPQLVRELQLQAQLFGAENGVKLEIDNKHSTISINDWRYKKMIQDSEHMLPAPEGEIIPRNGGILHRGANEIVKIPEPPQPIWKLVLSYLSLVFPIIVWFPEYCKRSEILSNIKRDVLAGVTIAIVLCPQGIAYALVAGMPPIYGLYTAFIPGLIYPWIGTSRVLAVG